MNHESRKSKTRSILIKATIVLILTGIVYAGFLLRSDQIANQEVPESRPAGKNDYVFDYARILTDVTPSTEYQLALIRKDYAIEALIVTLPSLPPSHTIQSQAAELFSNWKIA